MRPLGTRTAARAAAQVRDERRRRVAFVGHCLLNENTRYLGGAFCAGGVAEFIEDLVEQGIGICQMPCPEQHAWGGVWKRRMLLAYGSSETPLYRLRRPLLWLFLLHTRGVYRRLARQVAAQIADYDRSGFTVVAIVGVGASPTCGVRTILDVRCAFDAMARIPADALDRGRINREVVLGCQRAGAGLFIQALQRQLRRRRLAVPLLEHDIVLEMRGERQQVLTDLLADGPRGHPVQKLARDTGGRSPSLPCGDVPSGLAESPPCRME